MINHFFRLLFFDIDSVPDGKLHVRNQILVRSTLIMKGIETSRQVLVPSGFASFFAYGWGLPLHAQRSRSKNEPWDESARPLCLGKN